MYGEEWDGQQDLNGWWLSEKMDGVRAFWNGEKFITRHGMDIHCPDWFIDELPSNIRLDGELWLGRDQYEDSVTLIHGNEDDENMWRSARFIIFDLPSSPSEPYELRMQRLKEIQLPPHFEIVTSWKC